MSEATTVRLPRSWRFRRARRGHPYLHGFAFTFSGATYILISLMVGLAAVNQNINLLFLIFGILLGGLLVSGMVSTLTLTRLRAFRKLPPAVAAGQVVMLLYQVINRKRRLASYSLHIREHRSPAECGEVYLPIVHGGQTAEQPALLHCRRRGIYHFLAVTVYTRFPFSLFVHFARCKCVDELVVYPTIGRLTQQAVAAASRGASIGSQALPRSGGHEEFYGLREYRHGDNPRLIHWRRSAHVGTPVMREMSPLNPRRLIVMISLSGGADDRANVRRARPFWSRWLGTGPQPPVNPDERLERGLSLAATIIDEGLRRGLAVGLLVCDGACDGGQRWHAPIRGRQRWLDMMRTLAAVAPAPGPPAAPSAMPLDTRRQLARARCLWITRGLDDEQLRGMAGELAGWNISVQPIPVERADLDNMIVLPPVF